MRLSLKAPSQQFPPDGFPFQDAKTGFKLDGMSGNVQMQAIKIAEHRRANPHVYPPGESVHFDMDSIVQEIFRQKFQTHPHIFREGPDTPAPRRNETVVNITACVCGSTEFDITYCPTCGMRKVQSKKCKKCGKSYGK